ncbi:MAG: diadenylate cyclase CdaA [Planctomycetota bacterium]
MIPLLTALLQILIFSFLVYHALKFISGTRGMGVLKGILIVFVVFYALLALLARGFNLRELSWVLERMGPVSALILVLAFQPELRRAFVRLGENRGFAELGTGTGAIAASVPILEAVQELARRKIGALIVVCGDIGLASMHERGVRLDALLGTEILQSLFWGGNPLHDGAVVIRGERILAARCWIPEITDASVPGALGTRHRAGVKITEDSDALAIIVSEETGSVSVAIKGELARDLEPANLQTIVQAHLISHQGQARAGRS